MKSWIWSRSFLFLNNSMNSVNHCLEYFTSFRPLSLSPGVSGFRKSDARRVLRLTMVCSVEGMNPFEIALNIWYVCNFWWAIRWSDVSSSYWGSRGWRSPFCLDFFLDPKQEDMSNGVRKEILQLAMAVRRMKGCVSPLGIAGRYGILQKAMTCTTWAQSSRSGNTCNDVLNPALSCSLYPVNQWGSGWSL